MTTNDAAERLHDLWRADEYAMTLLDAALAAERRATVERIEERVESHIAAHSGKLTGDYLQGLADAVAMGHAILDAER
jgi:predicted alpha-1,6-mannanase (GH76 family)